MGGRLMICILCIICLVCGGVEGADKANELVVNPTFESSEAPKEAAGEAIYS
jgi:hypothetical protein